MEVMYSNEISSNYFTNKNFIGYIGELKDLKMFFQNIQTVKMNENSPVKRVINNNTELLNLLEIDHNILKKKVKDLSSTEYKAILLIRICNLHPRFIILNNFDLGFTSKMKRRISRFIKTINATYNSIFIIISNDIIFLNKCAKHIVISKNRIIKYQGDIINAIKQNFLDKPEIFKFIDLANENDANLEYTLDNKELLKAIYRSVF